MSVLKGKIAYGLAIGAALVAASGVVGLSMALTAGKAAYFPDQGYVLSANYADEGVQLVTTAFESGARVQNRFPNKMAFRSADGKGTTLPDDSFVHFSDGCFSCYADGCLINMKDAGEGFIEYYDIPALSLLKSQGNGWAAENNGLSIEFPQILWADGDNHYMIAGDNISFNLASGERLPQSPYYEVTYLENNIIQVLCAEGAWLTVAPGSHAEFPGGADIDLGTGRVTNANKEVCFTTTNMFRNDTLSMAVSINTDITNWQAPAFLVHNEDGEAGSDGVSGESGSAGDSGGEGGAGSAGAQGAAGAVGTKAPTMLIGDETNYADGRVGRVSIMDIENNGSDVVFRLHGSDPDHTLTGGTGVITVRDSLGNLVWKQDGMDFSDINENVTAAGLVKLLVPGEEYTVSLETDYAQPMQSGLINIGTTTLVSRPFSVSTSVVNITDVSLTYETINISITTEPGCGFTRAYCEVEIDGFKNPTPTISNLQPSHTYTFDPSVELNDTTSFPFGQDDYMQLCGREFTVTLYAGTSASDMTQQGKVYHGTLLKREPTANAVSAAKTESGYQLRLNLTSDPDKAFVGTRFVVTEENGLEVKTLTTSGTTASWYPDAGLNGNYTVTGYMIYNAGAVNVEKEAGSCTVNIDAGGAIAASISGTLTEIPTKQQWDLAAGIVLEELTNYTIPTGQNVVVSVISADGNTSISRYVNLANCAWTPATSLHGRKVTIPVNVTGIPGTNSQTGDIKGYNITIQGLLRHDIPRPNGDVTTTESMETLFRYYVPAGEGTFNWQS